MKYEIAYSSSVTVEANSKKEAQSLSEDIDLIAMEKSPKENPTMFTSKNLITSLDGIKDSKTGFEFGIRNWMM